MFAGIRRGLFGALGRSVVAPAPFAARPAQLFFSTEVYERVNLNNLYKNPGSTKSKKRIGRGIGSGTGKTAGRGHKGTRARQGGSVRIGFEGGQTPVHLRYPKFGFSNTKFKKQYEPLNLGKLQDWIDMGRVPQSLETENGIRLLTMRDMHESNIIGKIKHGVKLLGTGSDRLRTPIHIEVSKASLSAIEAVEKLGGTVTTAHYNRLALRALTRPHKFEPKLFPRRARPPPKHMPYFLNYANRGEYSPHVQMRNQQLGLWKEGLHARRALDGGFNGS
ncbi:ribosomal protein L18e/L15P [Pelagophyceae sp. CCMP2097]|nr:ribosomal protein L18e/L15P [Pelagophyceae sp. CCMP2097]